MSGWGIAADFGMGLLNNWYADERQEDQQTFNAQQMASAQQFDERMSNTAMQRRVMDLNAAGLNPLLAIGAGGASSPISPMASSGIASAQGFHPATSGMASASQASLANTQEELVRAQADKTKAEEKEIIARTDTHPVSIQQMQQNIEESRNRIQLILQQAATSSTTASNLEQQTVNLKELIPQIRATVDSLRAHAKLAGAQTTLAGAQTGLAVATTGKTKEETSHISQQVSANLPRLEAALRELERQQQVMSMPRHEQDSSVHDSFLGSLSATMRALNPFSQIMPTIGIRGTGAPTPPTPDRKFPRKH